MPMEITPSPRAHRDPAEQSTYGARTNVPWSDHQSPFRPRQIPDPASRSVVPYDGLSAALDRQLATNDPANELTELRHKYRRLKTRYHEVEAQRDTYVEERDRYQEQAREQTRRSRVLEQEVAELKRQVQTEKGSRKAMELEHKQMFDELNRARATIKIQCDQIEGRIDATLVKKTTDVAVRHKNPPPPPAKRFGENYGFGIKPAVEDPRESLYELEPAQQQRQPMGKWRAIEGTSRALTMQPKEPRYDFPWSSQLSSLFVRIEQYSRTYLSLVTKDEDDQWPQKLAFDVVEESDVDHVEKIAADGQVRHMLLSRFIVSWIANHYFHSRIVKGFSKETDQKVQATRSQTRPDNPIELVRTLAQAEAKAIEEITLAPGFDSWRAGQLRLDFEIMTTRLQEAIVPRAASPPPLGKAFGSILADGWRVGLRMATCTDQFTFRFPTAITSTKYDHRVHLNRDPYITGPPAELEKQGVSIALGITPYITVNNPLAAKMEEQPVHLANVLLSRRTNKND
ncbi:MAG: hypothetical protein Q9176_003403 [Flavoplaca citrina]